ncbi:hypothetical protein [Kordiimonas sp.]|uniref:hypothetical protein n=1 Tax=Kordiimonas sp. TaxID=1970157 RepID=UPI003A9241BB
MLLRWLRKDNAFWDIAVAAVLLNALVQINCFMVPGVGPQGVFGYDLSLWCSVDKAGAAATAQVDGESGGTRTCTDCRQCTGQAVAVMAEVVQPAGAPFSSDPVSFQPSAIAVKSFGAASYDGRGPPSLSQA